MDDQEFRLQADRALSDLNHRLILASDHHSLEADMSGGALVIEFEEPPGKFVVSPNAPVHQVWVSALSRSFKLEWDASRQEFVLPGGGESLAALIGRCAAEYLGEPVKL